VKLAVGLDFKSLASEQDTVLYTNPAYTTTAGYPSTSSTDSDFMVLLGSRIKSARRGINDVVNRDYVLA
jgi:hypothetical protein